MNQPAEFTHIDEGVFSQGVISFWRPRGTGARAAMLLALIASCAIFGLGSHWMGVPDLPNFDGSLLLSPRAGSDLLAVTALLVVATLAGTVLAGAVRFEAGLFAGCLGLAIISLRSGTMQTVLFEANGASQVYFTLSGELLILSAILLLLWTLHWMAGRASFVKPMPEDSRGDAIESTHLVGNIAALITQALATSFILLLLCQTEAKNQVLASLVVASWLGTSIAYMSFPTRPSIWYWTGPLLAGFVGYLLAASGQNTGLEIGNPQGLFAGLARPLPIDYASIGPAASIAAYWLMRKRPPDEEQE